MALGSPPFVDAVGDRVAEWRREADLASAAGAVV
jgi:hypothetical protein